VSNLKSVALTVLELLAFDARKFSGSRDPGDATIRKICRAHISTVPVNVYTKFGIRSFNRFGAISI